VRNQPKYHFIKNTSYALKGLKDLLLTETSFRIELVAVCVLIPLLWFFSLELWYKLLMFSSLTGILIAEAINSAIERVTDLVTLEHHEMAGRAKDMGSTVVFLSICVCIVIWCFGLWQWSQY
jgi:diacylglycerol kinase (ATP)